MWDSVIIITRINRQRSQGEISPVTSRSETGVFPRSHKTLPATVFYGVVMAMADTWADAIAAESARVTSGVTQLCLESRRSSVRAASLCFKSKEHGGRNEAPSDCLESLRVHSGSGSPHPCRMVSTSLQNESRQSLSGCCCWSWEDASLVLWVSSAAAWSRVPAHGSTLISVGLGFLVQTYTHGKKSQACMQTTEQTRNGTYEHGRWRRD